MPQYRVSGMGEAPQSSLGGRLFFQPFEANFVENLRMPGVLRPQKGSAGKIVQNPTAKPGKSLNIPAGADANYACQQRKGGGQRPPGTERAR